ncbi:hypothetical protein ONA91_06270 [Micromonospora sp. DR5-3]|uniref:hypothetical protein n=1 Tax=unclassified Micromonospora TaxID=2617518 RepID=UPI0011D38D30|nr:MULTISPECIES: hypothetical protein [unclassified Micromonospora]MCW3814061.1 hypothetical protein [Micromonospora sp. DR5-3]TYC23591.1 hypothetical protein FXF52_14555 [Micromonospora sp. MP36]
MSSSSPLPAYAVPGVRPSRTSQDGRQISWRGDQLAREAPVAAVLDRAPQVLLPIARPDLGEEPLSHKALCEVLYLGTSDGLRWDLSLGDEVKLIVDTGCDLVDEDLIEEALAAQPDVAEAYHADRELFDVSLTRVLRADDVFARWLDAIITAHRELAQRRGVELPD